MKYRLINQVTNEETICEKLIIDGFDYYTDVEKTQMIIATSNPNHKSGYVLSPGDLYHQELEKRRERAKQFKGQVAGRHPDAFTNSEMLDMVRGYEEACEKIDHLFTKEDMIEFATLWLSESPPKSVRQVFEDYLSKKYKVIYYK